MCLSDGRECRVLKLVYGVGAWQACLGFDGALLRGGARDDQPSFCTTQTLPLPPILSPACPPSAWHSMAPAPLWPLEGRRKRETLVRIGGVGK